MRTGLTFEVLGARPAPAAGAPAIQFRLRVAATGGERIHALALRVQVQIDARRRRYAPREQERLYELFGEPAQWDRSLKPIVWSQATALVPAFEERAEFDLPIACTYDFEVASAKYLHAVRDGEIPLLFLFSGTAFFTGGPGFTVEPVPWDRDAAFQMPAQLWRDAMDRHFPGTAWVRVSRETLDALQAFRGRHALMGWDATFEALLQETIKERV